MKYLDDIQYFIPFDPIDQCFYVSISVRIPEVIRTPKLYIKSVINKMQYLCPLRVLPSFLSVWWRLPVITVLNIVVKIHIA